VTGKGSFSRFLPSCRQRTERGVCLGPARRLQPADGSPEQLDHSVRRVPCFGVTNWWASVGVLKTGMSPISTRAALFMGLAR
jgi:hypothetical protein